MSRLRVTLLVFLSTFISANTAFPQTLARLGGMIFDPSNKAVVGAKVEIRSADTAALRSATTDGGGLYEFPGLTPGTYSIEVIAAGFSTGTRTARLEVGQNMRLDLTLALGDNKTSLDISGVAETLKTEDASVGEVVETKAVRELPLNGRMLLDLALTVPGTHMGHGAQTGTSNPLYWRPNQASALSIGGNRPNANYFLIDGASNIDPTFNTQILSLSPDAVLEFQVQTGSYAAEMGGGGGGQINIVTRGGTQNYHGSAYAFVRNGAFDARTFNESATGKFLVQNNFGAAVGGPLKGKKLFFFTNYEGGRKVKAETQLATVPTAAEAAGDFSTSGANIFNPFSSSPNSAFNPSLPVSAANPQIIRAPFPGNVIPPSLLGRAASTMLSQYIVRPNTNIVPGKPDSNNYRDQRNSRNITDQGTLRVDRVFDSGDNLFARYSVGKEDGFTPQNLPGFGFLHDNLAQNANITWIKIISPAMVNTATLGFSRLAMEHHNEAAGNDDIVSKLGIQGVGFGGQKAWGAPYFNVQGYTQFGDNYQATPMATWNTVLEGRDVLSWQLGRHAVKIGGSYRWFIWPMWAFVQGRGYYQFTNGFTTRTATADGTGAALASFELELPAVRQRQVGSPSMNLRQFYADGFVQDTFRLNTKTTINAGVRYEYMSPMVDVTKQWSSLFVTPTSLTAYIGGQLGTPKGLYFSNKRKFAPRIGLVRQFGGGLVARAGYGIFYTPIDMNTWCNQLHNAPIIFSETNQSDAFVPSISSLNFGPAILGSTVTSFTAFDAHQKPQYIQQWNLSVEKAIGNNTTLEVSYQGARGFHLQRAHLINNAPPGPGLLQPRRPYQSAQFLPGTKFPDDVTVASSTFRISTLNYLENTAQSWYDAAYINVRRRFSNGLSFLANYTYAKSLSDAPDFRSPMFESAVPQNNNDLRSEKGPACDLRHRFVLSGVYEIGTFGKSPLMAAVTRHWQISTIYQAQSGFPFTISVFGDTANTGTVLGENPVRANYNGQPVFTESTNTPEKWFNTSAFTAPAPYTYGNVGRNTVFGPGMQTIDMSISRGFSIKDKATFLFRAEAFNTLNRVNLGTPNRFVNTAQFGTITSTDTPGRQLQLSARLTF